MNKTLIQTKHGPTNLFVFESMQEAVRYVDADKNNSFINNDNEGFHGRSWSKVCKLAVEGDEAAIARVTKLLDKIDATFRDREGLKWVPSVGGAYPCVPDFLAGNPECMRARQPVEDDRSPLRIVLDLGVSAGVSIEQAEARGACAAALAMRLVEERPVELWAISAMQGGFDFNQNTITAWRVCTTPLSTNDVAFGLASIEAFRRIMFGVIDTLKRCGNSIGWLNGYQPTDVRYEAMIRQALELEDKDVLLRGMFVTESRKNPEQWVADQLEKQRTVD